MRSKAINNRVIGIAVLVLLGALGSRASAVSVFFDDAPKNGGVALGALETFSFGGWGLDETAVADGNEFLVMSAGGDFSGAGVAAHVDINEPGFGGNGLQNGNVIRVSMWLASAPDNPLMFGDAFIDVVKVEFYDVALANPNTMPQNKILDTDTSLGMATPFTPLSTTEWTQYVHTYVVDQSQFVFNNPEDDLSVVQEVRGVLFAGDFAGLSDQSGAMYVDNVRVEVFENEAAVTPIDTTYPGALVDTPGVAGDYNENNTVDAADYTTWRDRLGSGTALPNDDTAGVGEDDYTRWKNNFGMSTPGGGSLGAAAVPEPAAWTLALATMLCSLVLRRSK